MAHEYVCASSSIRWSKELGLSFICLRDSQKDFFFFNGQIHHCSVTADNLGCATFKKEYLKTNLPHRSSYMPVHVGGGQECREV